MVRIPSVIKIFMVFGGKSDVESVVVFSNKEFIINKVEVIEDEVFLKHMDKITVVSREEIIFLLKCELEIRERMG